MHSCGVCQVHRERRTRLSSQPRPTSLSALVTTGQISLRYLSAAACLFGVSVPACKLTFVVQVQLRTPVLGEEDGEGALLQQPCGVVLLLKLVLPPVVDVWRVPGLVLLVL